MRLPRSVLDGYSDALGEIEKRASSALLAAISAIDWDDPSAVEALEQLFESLCATSAYSAGELAAAFYDTLRESSVGKRIGAKAHPSHVPEATRRLYQSALQKAAEGKSGEIADLLVSRISYEVKRAAGNSIMRNAVDDPRKVKFARVPMGADTCGFCQMLASRGFKYATAKSAGEGNHYHANCDCLIVPGFDDSTTVEGYDPGAIYEQWRESDHAEYMERRADRLTDEGVINSIIKARRKTEAYGGVPSSETAALLERKLEQYRKKWGRDFPL